MQTITNTYSYQLQTKEIAEYFLANRRKYFK